MEREIDKLDADMRSLKAQFNQIQLDNARISGFYSMAFRCASIAATVFLFWLGYTSLIQVPAALSSAPIKQLEKVAKDSADAAIEHSAAASAALDHAQKTTAKLKDITHEIEAAFDVPLKDEGYCVRPTRTQICFKQKTISIRDSKNPDVVSFRIDYDSFESAPLLHISLMPRTTTGDTCAFALYSSRATVSEVHGAAIRVAGPSGRCKAVPVNVTVIAIGEARKLTR